jgi:serine/threonine-protein kinase HipA
LKPQIGTLPNGLDLSHSVENEFYCLKLLAAFGLPVANVQIQTFGKVKALVVERFDRAWQKNNRLLRLPVEDLCQALGCPPGRKYQSEGGPGIVAILDLLKGADAPASDQKIFLKAQILFWLIGATDGHAKNFSIFLGPGGSFRLAPVYDVLTAQPSADSRQVERKQMKLAIFVGDRRHYRIDEVQGRHFIQSTELAGLPGALAKSALDEIADTAGQTLNQVQEQLPAGFPPNIHHAVQAGVMSRLGKI